MSSLSAKGPSVMTFRPTMAEFQDFSGYVDYMESQGAHLAGIAKVIPPAEWRPRATGYGELAGDGKLSTDPIADLVIPTPIVQSIGGRTGIYQQLHKPRSLLTVRQLYELSRSKRYAPPQQSAPRNNSDSDTCNKHHYDEMERLFWRNLLYSTPIYGADVDGTLSDPQIAGAWNPGKLSSLLDLVQTDYGVRIRGVNSPYLYFGMWMASFAWHTEDMDLYSINYLHFGAPKSWYVVRPEDGRRFERVADLLYPAEQQHCPAYLRHKTTMLAPFVLRSKGVPVQRIEQEAGEFVVTFPYGYHAGYNHGFNCAESSNFATRRWVEYGKRAMQCKCKADAVRIDMDVFVRKYQPENWERWQMGVDVGRHPEDDGVAGQQHRVTMQRPPALQLHICSPTKRNCRATLLPKTNAVRRHRKRKMRRSEESKCKSLVVATTEI